VAEVYVNCPNCGTEYHHPEPVPTNAYCFYCPDVKLPYAEPVQLCWQVDGEIVTVTQLTEEQARWLAARLDTTVSLMPRVPEVLTEANKVLGDGS